MKKNSKFLQQLLKYAKLDLRDKKERSKLNKYEFLSDQGLWDITTVYKGCKVENDTLYDSEGILLSDDGCCMNESIPYFVNQSTGYCEDDFYGTLFVQVAKDTFVAVYYMC